MLPGIAGLAGKVGGATATAGTPGTDPEFVGGKSFGFAGVAGPADEVISLTDLTGGLASAPAEGDLVIVSYAVAGGSILGVSTAGYTEIEDFSAGGGTNNTNMSVSRKFMGGTPDTSVTLKRQTTNTGVSHAGTIHVWRGVDQTTPDDVSRVQSTNTSNDRPDPPSVTPVTPSSVAVFVGAGSSNGSPAAPTSSDLDHFFGVVAGNIVDANAGVGSKLWTGGAINPAQWGGAAGTASSAVALAMVLRPAVPPSGPYLAYSATNGAQTTTANSIQPTINYYSGTPSYSIIAGTLPPSMSLNSATGEISGTPSSTGTYSGIRIRITANGVYHDCAAFSIEAATGYRYYFIEFLASSNNFLGCATFKLIDGGSVDRALSSGGASCSVVGYTVNGGFPIANINDGNDGTFTTSSSAAAGTGKGWLFDLGSTYSITKWGYRSRNDSFGSDEAITSGKIWGKVVSSDPSYTLLYTITEAAWGDNEYRERTI